MLSGYAEPCCAKYRTRAPDLSKRVGGIPEALDRAMVRAGIATIKPRVVQCGEKAGVSGTVKIALAVDPEGTVTSASVEVTPDAALGACVAGVLRGAKFGKSVTGGSFTYPFLF